MGRPVPRVATTYYLRCQVSNKKITRNSEKQESMIHEPEKKQASETACDSAYMLGLSGKDSKVAIINMYRTKGNQN